MRVINEYEAHNHLPGEFGQIKILDLAAGAERDELSMVVVLDIHDLYMLREHHATMARMWRTPGVHRKLHVTLTVARHLAMRHDSAAKLAGFNLDRVLSFIHTTDLKVWLNVDEVDGLCEQWRMRAEEIAADALRLEMRDDSPLFLASQTKDAAKHAIIKTDLFCQLSLEFDEYAPDATDGPTGDTVTLRAT